MLETRRVTTTRGSRLSHPDISRQRVFTACLWKVNRVLADPPSAPVRTLAESVLQWVWKGARWKGANGEASPELVSYGGAAWSGVPGVRSPVSSVSDLSEPYLVQNPESRVRTWYKKHSVP